MLIGDELWDARVTAGMREANAHGRAVTVFEDAPTSLYASLVTSAERSPDAVALVDDAQAEITFGELLAKVNEVSALLGNRIAPGERVALLLETSIEFAIAVYAVNSRGAVAVPISTKLREPVLQTLLGLAESSLIIAEERFKTFDALRESGAELLWAEDRSTGYGFRDWEFGDGPAADLPEVDPDADCLLMFTSGTTAVSKGVLLTNRGVGHAITAYQHVLGIDSNDSTVLPVPIAYVTGLVAMLGLFVHSGAKLYLHQRFDADRLLQTMQQEDITFLHVSPTAHALLLTAGKRAGHPELPSLRMLASGSAHMPVSRIRALHEWLPRAEFRTIYGLTETTSPALIFPVDAATSPHCGSSGLPIPGLTVSIRDQSGAEVPQGQRGSVWLRGTNILRRYDRIETEALTDDGWLDTGDVGYIGEDGYVFLVDRTKDMINRGGEKVWCIDVEEALRRLDDVTDAAVVGIPDELYGEVPAALVVPAPGSAPTHESIVERLSPVLARYQIPVHYLVRDEMPLTPNMKTDKQRVRELLSEPAAA